MLLSIKHACFSYSANGTPQLIHGLPNTTENKILPCGLVWWFNGKRTISFRVGGYIYILHVPKPETWLVKLFGLIYALAHA